MRLLPRTLLWRSFLLLTLVSVTTTAAWFVIFRVYEQQPRIRQVAQNLASVVNLTRTALITADTAKRRALLVELSEQEGIQVYPVDEGEHLVPPPDSNFARQVNAQMRLALGEQTRFASERDGQPGFWVSFRIDEDEYWLRFPRERVDRRLALQWAGWGALALLFSLLAAWLIVRHVVMPMRALAGAAAAIGRGETPPPVPETGPEEVRRLARDFNQMSRELSRLAEDRALILAGVSHDLRTPLARLRLGVEMSAGAGGADDSLRQGMTADIEEMDRIIGQFLDFARPADGGTGGEAPQSIDLAELAAGLAAHYHRVGRPVMVIASEPLDVRARPQALRRAAMNLIDNALHHAGGGVELAVRRDGATALFEVLDRGPGIPPAEAERLKLPFTRLDASRTGVSGSGLGLAIVDRVMRAHGGRLDLLPREGGGLTARLSLPV